MKISRRGLGGLFAGAAAAFYPDQAKVNNLGSFPPIPTTDSVGNSPTPMSPEDEFKYLLSQATGTDYTPGFQKRNRYEHYQIIDPDVAALKSCSPVGRELIQRTRWHRAAIEDHRSWITSRLDDLLKRYPYLKAFT